MLRLHLFFFFYSVSELFVESGDSGRDRIHVLLNISLLRLDCEGKFPSFAKIQALDRVFNFNQLLALIFKTQMDVTKLALSKTP